MTYVGNNQGSDPDAVKTANFAQAFQAFVGISTDVAGAVLGFAVAQSPVGRLVCGYDQFVNVASTACSSGMFQTLRFRENED